MSHTRKTRGYKSSRKQRGSPRRSILGNIKKASSRALPTVERGLTAVGSAARVAAVKTAPVLQKGVAAVYGTMATGFNLGVKGAKNVASGVSTMAKSSKMKRSRKHSSRRRKH